MIAILLGLMVGCGTPTERAQPPKNAVFPHSADFIAQHGPASLVEGAPCLSCHTQTGSEGAVTCTSCHAAYPHEADFGTSGGHGKAWAADARACTNCHGGGGTRPPADVQGARCVGCHSVYPHGAGWKQAESHGAAAIARGGAVACAGCHGAAGDLPSESPCTSCHAQYPHPQGWQADGHGAASLDDPSACATCHAATKAVRCDSCHDIYPHAADWTSLGHISATQVRGEPACITCHDNGVSGPDLPVSCAPACHGVP